MKPAATETLEELTWHNRALAAVHHNIDLDQPFGADDLQAVVGKPSSPGQFGAFFKNPEVRALIEPIGFKVSAITGNPIYLWAGREEHSTQEKEAA